MAVAQCTTPSRHKVMKSTALHGGESVMYCRQLTLRRVGFFLSFALLCCQILSPSCRFKEFKINIGKIVVPSEKNTTKYEYSCDDKN